MKLKVRDLVATVLVAAIAVPYVGYLIDSEMPFVKDTRGVTGVGLVLGLAAFAVLERGDVYDRILSVETGLGVVSVVLGLMAAALAETAASEALLALFMVSILVVWAVKVAGHAGVLPMHHHPTGTA